MSFSVQNETSFKPVLVAQSERDSRWAAVLQHDATFDGVFVYAVKTTGIYCRPSCPSRRPKFENVDFYKTCEEAETAGFRACQRCRPNEASHRAQHADVITKACRSIEAADEPLPVEALARASRMSPSHFHRVFKSVTGITPKAFAAAHRTKRVREQLSKSRDTVTEAIYDAGFNSGSRFYETSNAVLGMTPKAFRSGGKGVVITFAVGVCSLGSVLVAYSKKGVCAIFLGDDAQQLAHELQVRFPNATLIAGDAEFETLVAAVIGFVETPALGFNLPLDVQGTAFQQRVWQELCAIPCGKTVSYADIARRINAPKSVRAVAGACAANKIAVAIPCHRVVTSDGKLSGYRWGVARKRTLLERESKG